MTKKTSTKKPTAAEKKQTEDAAFLKALARAFFDDYDRIRDIAWREHDRAGRAGTGWPYAL